VGTPVSTPHLHWSKLDMTRTRVLYEDNLILCYCVILYSFNARTNITDCLSMPKQLHALRWYSHHAHVIHNVSCRYLEYLGFKNEHLLVDATGCTGSWLFRSAMAESFTHNIVVLT
jgi:hypothetical protein